MMPGLDGFEVCRQLRAEPGLQHTPIILLTALNAPALEAKGAAVGATHSLHKPFGIERVVRTVEQTLGRSPRPEMPGHY